ncbi:MAG: FlgD immunoglobulin-like domain containing protein, partial [Desulfocucumaceae bacterium]
KRFFTTLDKNIALSFKVNGSEMGSTVAGGASTIQVLATDGNGELFTEVKLFDKNHNTVNTWTLNTASVNISYNRTTASGDYYYVKIKQADGNEAISSPVFVFGTLSVSLSSLTATSAADGINISWRTESENNSFRWSIERAVAGTDVYSVITSMPAQGHSNSPADYNWLDSTATPGIAYLYCLKEIGLSGNTAVYGPVTASCLENPLKRGFDLMAACPNPFTSKTMVAYHIRENCSEVSLKIYNICGQMVKTWPATLKPAGSHQFIWDGTDNNHRILPAGIYLVRLRVNNNSYSNKISRID